MGSLHEGHDSLLKKCQKENDISIVSIYVNPSQFNCSNDFKNYPRNLDLDIKRLNKLNCDIFSRQVIMKFRKLNNLELI